MKHYTYKQFLQLYDHVNEKGKEQIQKYCYRFFMAWPEDKWKSTSHSCDFKLRVNGEVRTYLIPISFVVNHARSYVRENCDKDSEKTFFLKYREFSEKVMQCDVQKLQDVFQNYVHSEKGLSRSADLDRYLTQYATRDELALYQEARNHKINKKAALEQQRKQDRFKLEQKSFETVIQYGLNSPEFLALSKEFMVTITTLRSYALKYLKSDFLTDEEREKANLQYREALQRFKQDRTFAPQSPNHDDIAQASREVLDFIQSDSQDPSSKVKEAAQLLFEQNPSLYEQYYQKVTGDNVPLYSSIRSVTALAKEAVQNHSQYTPTFALHCFFELGQPVNEVLSIAQSLLSSNDFNYFKSISNYYTRLLKSEVNWFIPTMDDFMAQQIEVHCLLDANGMPIAGTGEQVTLEHKKEIVQLMESYHIPFCFPIYNAALRLYMNGDLMLFPKTKDPNSSNSVKILSMKGSC